MADPEVVVLCGSTRFRAEFEREVIRLGLEGKIVLNVSCYGHSGDLPPEACIDGHPTKTALDELHKRKIDMADRVLVINPGGYIGSSTRSEIEYAERFEKPIDYLVDPAGAAAHDCGHACCNERSDPLHDHFLRPTDCPSCKRQPAPVAPKTDTGQHGAQDARWHVPQVARRSDGRWGVFCAACSHSHGDYINPCQAFTQDEWPPPILEATDATRL